MGSIDCVFPRLCIYVCVLYICIYACMMYLSIHSSIHPTISYVFLTMWCWCYSCRMGGLYFLPHEPGWIWWAFVVHPWLREHGGSDAMLYLRIDHKNAMFFYLVLLACSLLGLNYSAVRKLSSPWKSSHGEVLKLLKLSVWVFRKQHHCVRYVNAPFWKLFSNHSSGYSSWYHMEQK